MFRPGSVSRFPVRLVPSVILRMPVGAAKQPIQAWTGSARAHPMVAVEVVRSVARARPGRPVLPRPLVRRRLVQDFLRDLRVGRRQVQLQLGTADRGGEEILHERRRLLGPYERHRPGLVRDGPGNIGTGRVRVGDDDHHTTTFGLWQEETAESVELRNIRILLVQLGLVPYDVELDLFPGLLR